MIWALVQCTGIRILRPWEEYSKGLILLQLHYMYNHVSVSRPHGPLVWDTHFCLWHGQKKYSESTLCLKKYCFVKKKKNVATTCREKKFRCATNRNKNISTPKKPSPFKLNGGSLCIIQRHWMSCFCWVKFALFDSSKSEWCACNNA